MSTWKERAREEIARQETEKERAREEIARQETEKQAIKLTMLRDEDAARLSKEQEMIELTKIKVVEFDKLRVFGKLQQINKDLFKGHGEVQEQLNPLSKSVTLIYLGVDEDCVRELTEAKSVTAFGRYYESSGNRHVDQGGSWDGNHYNKRFGFHRDLRPLTTGVEEQPHRLWPLTIRYSFEPDSENTEIEILDDANGYVFKKPDLPKNCRFDVNIGSTDRGWYRWGSFAKTSFLHSQYDQEALSLFIDAMLLQSCVARLPLVEEWEEKRKKADIKARKIRSRIGK